MLAQQIRKIVLEQSKRAHVGGIGSALSIADILACLYDAILRIPNSTMRTVTASSFPRDMRLLPYTRFFTLKAGSMRRR